MRNTQKKPKHIKLTAQQFEELQLKIQSNNLSATEKDLVTGSLSSFLWLKSQLEQSKITIAQLKSLFGISTDISPIFKMMKSYIIWP